MISSLFRYVIISSRLSHLKSVYEESKRLLNDIDLILEAHKQLTLIEQVQNENSDNCTADNDNVPPETSQQSKSLLLEQVQQRISYLEQVQQAFNFLATVSIPSVASSLAFSSSLSLLLSSSLNSSTNTNTNTNINPNSHLLSPQLIQRVCYFEQKCWDNAILAMERVLERDLISIEAYLDDSVYKEMRDKVLKELIRPLLINPRLFEELIIHFVTSYCQLRINFVTFILDTRLNNQFSTSPPLEQVLHLIERTRLLMVVETKEFHEIFSLNLPLQSHLNKILETVGNLLLQRIESPCKQLSPKNSAEISSFIHPLMDSIFITNQKDPFGFFLKLLVEKFNFKKPIIAPNIKIDSEISEMISNTNTNAITNDNENITNNNIINV